jgi:hypothetical protein
MQPMCLLPYQKIGPLDGKDRKSLMAFSTISKTRSITNSVLRVKDELNSNTITSQMDSPLLQ